jgi:DNA-binding response OmpR family regulator
MSTPFGERAHDPADPERARRPVLIVEDERSIALVVAEVVADAGHVPIVARHGREALILARDHWPDLLITDLMLPHLDGGGLIAALRAEAAERTMPPIILMTAVGRRHARAAGADAILHKPFDLSELEALLRRFLG